MCDMLVVEDDPILRVTLAEALRDEGFEVAEAANGTDALDILHGPRAAKILVTDINLGSPPDGIEVAEEAMRRHDQLRVIYATGSPHRLRRHRLGPKERVLCKPFAPVELIEVACALMGSEQQERGSP
jgi:CheY-like chemotaxis protein